MLIKKKDIHQLSTVREDYCISIFIPTHRSGFDNAKIDQLKFKNALGDTTGVECVENAGEDACLMDDYKRGIWNSASVSNIPFAVIPKTILTTNINDPAVTDTNTKAKTTTNFILSCLL